MTRQELEGAPKKVQDILVSFPERVIENVMLTEEAEELAIRRTGIRSHNIH